MEKLNGGVFVKYMGVRVNVVFLVERLQVSFPISGHTCWSPREVGCFDRRERDSRRPA
jgi:hypothetical protein